MGFKEYNLKYFLEPGLSEDNDSSERWRNVSFVCLKEQVLSWTKTRGSNVTKSELS